MSRVSRVDEGPPPAANRQDRIGNELHASLREDETPWLDAELG